MLTTGGDFFFGYSTVARQFPASSCQRDSLKLLFLIKILFTHSLYEAVQGLAKCQEGFYFYFIFIFSRKEVKTTRLKGFNRRF